MPDACSVDVRHLAHHPASNDGREVAWVLLELSKVWQMDVVGGVLLADGTECKVLTGVDDHSRFCVCAGIMVRATARPVCGLFVQALGRHGVPEEILTDNGKVFTGRFGRNDTEVLFDKICRDNGIVYRLTAPRSPHDDGEGRAVPPHAADRVLDRPAVRRSGGRAGRAGRLG